MKPSMRDRLCETCGLPKPCPWGAQRLVDLRRILDASEALVLHFERQVSRINMHVRAQEKGKK